VVQRERFAAQLSDRQSGDDEAMQVRKELPERAVQYSTVLFLLLLH